MKTVFQRDERCLHCRVNPEGIKPFIERPGQNDEKTLLTKALLKEMSKKENIPEECVLCSAMMFYWTKSLPVDIAELSLYK